MIKIQNKRVDTAIRKIVNLFKDYKETIALYLYGSAMSDDFDYRRSDIDFLIIVDDLKNSHDFIKRIKRQVNLLKKIKLDINIVFLSEFKKRWHIYRPPSYFVGIKHRSKLLLGNDLLKSVKDSEITRENIYKRVVDLSQSSRGIYLNNKEPDFWAKKYIEWLRMVVLEILFLAGDFDLNFFSGLKKIKKRYKGLLFLDQLRKNQLSMKEINEIAEGLREFMLINFINEDNSFI